MANPVTLDFDGLVAWRTGESRVGHDKRCGGGDRGGENFGLHDDPFRF